MTGIYVEMGKDSGYTKSPFANANNIFTEAAGGAREDHARSVLSDVCLP